MKKIILSLAIIIVLSISVFATQPIVIDAVNYEKTVITADYALDMGIEQGAFGKHTVRIPKINLDTPTVQKINKEIYEIGGGVYELLLNNQESNMIYNYGYFYKEESGVVGIVVTKRGGIQCGGINNDYKAFYYDKRTDRQLSFKEYLSALGVNINDLSNNSKVKKAYENAGQDGSIVVLDALLDSKSSVVYVKTPMSMDSSMMVESDTPLVKIQLNNPFALYTGKINEIVMTVGNKTAYVSGEAVKIDAEPIISNGRTMLPARFVAEKLGATVDWDDSDKKVTIKKDALKIELVVGSNVAYVNGGEVTLDSPVFIQDERTYTPVRFIVETLEATIDWLSETKQVVIYKNVSVADKLHEYYNENKKSFVTQDMFVPNAFLADLDDDYIPELCLSYGDGGYRDWLEIIKYKNGQIYNAGTISGGSGTGISSNFDLIYDLNGDIFIWYEYYSVFIFDDRQNSFSYSEYCWHEEDDIIRYNLTVSQNIDKYSYSINGGEEVSTTAEKKQSLIKEVEARRNKYLDRKIDIGNCSFFEVWNKQAKIRTSK